MMGGLNRFQWIISETTMVYDVINGMDGGGAKWWDNVGASPIIFNNKWIET